MMNFNTNLKIYIYKKDTITILVNAEYLMHYDIKNTVKQLKSD